MKYTDKRTWTVRIVAIVMAVLLLLGIFSLLFNSAFAAGDIAEIAATGSQDTPKWPIFAAVGALVVIVVCAVIPKLNKKD
jgi:di/tricarboxylate transporter